MNKVTADQIKAFLILSKETKMELMMRRARYHGTDLDIPETEQRRIEKLERQLLFYDALMAWLHANSLRSLSAFASNPFSQLQSCRNHGQYGRRWHRQELGH